MLTQLFRHYRADGSNGYAFFIFDVGTEFCDFHDVRPTSILLEVLAYMTRLFARHHNLSFTD
jgi:hypothetical protein